MRTSLLEFYHGLAEPPASVVNEARGWGLDLHSPIRDHWETVSDFVDAYCRDVTPAGVLVVASDPSVAGGHQTGIPLTDAARARDALSLDALLAEPDPRSGAFWSLVADARKASGPGATLEGLFANVHLAHAFPYALAQGRSSVAIEKYLPSMPVYSSDARAKLGKLVRALRPQVVATIGRVAFEAVASLADNRLDLAADLATNGFDGVVAGREYADGLRAYPRATFGVFRSYLVPVGDLEGASMSHTRDTLVRLFGDAWN